MQGLSAWALGVAMGVALVPAWRLIRNLLEGPQGQLWVDMRTKERLEMHARERDRA